MPPFARGRTPKSNIQLALSTRPPFSPPRTAAFGYDDVITGCDRKLYCMSGKRRNDDPTLLPRYSASILTRRRKWARRRTAPPQSSPRPTSKCRALTCVLTFLSYSVSLKLISASALDSEGMCGIVEGSV
jgi:hypothetical protein